MKRSLATRRSPPAARSGFTLIEMLTVVVIIGILASLMTVAALKARTRVRIAVIHTEVLQLNTAVLAVEKDYGNYPPDFTDYNTTNKTWPAVDRWLFSAFPRYVLTGSNTTLSQQMVADITNNYGVSISNPASALVVFLGGVPGVTGTYTGYSVQSPNGVAIPWRSDGFYGDVTCPFGPNNPYPAKGTPLQPRIAPKFTFPSIRVDTSLGSPFFCPPAVTATAPNTIPAPYVYFRAGLDQTTGAWCYLYNNGFQNVAQLFSPSGSSADFAVPYQKAVPANNNAVINPPWRNNDTFQIISSGLDGLYGGPNKAATGPYVAGRVSLYPQGLSPGDFDNVTNFIQNGSTIEDELKL